MRLGLRLGFNRQGGTATPAEPAPTQAETTALLARMTVQPDATRAAKINEYIYALKQCGAWDQLIFLHVLSAHTEQAAKLDWRNTYDLSQTGTVAFVVDEGFTPASSADYLFNFALPDLMVENEGHVGGFARTNTSGSSVADIVWFTSATRLAFRDNSVGGVPIGTIQSTGAVASGAGIPTNSTNGLIVNRTSSTSIQLFSNGVGAAPVTTAITSTRGNSGGCTIGQRTTGARQIRIAHGGLKLTEAQAVAVHNAGLAYLA